MLSRSVRSNLLWTTRCISQSSSVFSQPESQRPSPSKQAMLAIDWQLKGLVPMLFKGGLGGFFQRMRKDVEFEDRIFNYKIKDPYQLTIHLLKVRAYYRYKSPHNKVEHLGSIYYEGEDMLTVLWRLSSLKSNFIRYFPKLITGKAPEYRVVEGALEIYVGDDDRIYKMINRPITDNDKEEAKKFAEFKKESLDEIRRREMKISASAAEQIADRKRNSE